MPKNKDLKRLVRERMARTGESYTAARTRLLEKAGARVGEELTLAAVAGCSDESLESRTGHAWAWWVKELDAVQAVSMPHREIAKHVSERYEISGWWAQTVTVGYERIKGLREIGQRRDGLFDANRSKTFAVPIAKLYRAFSQVRVRARWLRDVDWRVRTATTDKSMRLDWPDGTRVNLYFMAKGDAKSSVAVQHGRLTSRADVERRKAFWGERLTALAEVLA